MPDPIVPAPQPVPTPGAPSRAIPWTLVCVLGIAIVLAWMWAQPAFKSIQDENKTLKSENSILKTQLNETKDITTYYPNGKIKSTTKIKISKKTSNKTSKLETAESKHKEVVKRSIVSVGVLFGDSYIPKGANFNSQVIGPLGVTGMATWDSGFKVMLGPQLSF